MKNKLQTATCFALLLLAGCAQPETVPVNHNENVEVTDLTPEKAEDLFYYYFGEKIPVTLINVSSMNSNEFMCS